MKMYERCSSNLGENRMKIPKMYCKCSPCRQMLETPTGSFVGFYLIFLFTKKAFLGLGKIDTFG